VSGTLLFLMAACVAVPSVGLEMQSLDETWGSEERTSLEDDLTARLLERGHPVGGANSTIEVELVTLPSSIIVVVRSGAQTEVHEISSSGPIPIVRLEIIHRVLSTIAHVSEEDTEPEQAPFEPIDPYPQPSDSSLAIGEPSREPEVARAWNYDAGASVGVILRGVDPPHRGFDGWVDLTFAAVHSSGWGIGTSFGLVPSGAVDLSVLEALVSVGPAYRRAIARRLRFQVSAELGALFHLAWFVDEPTTRRIDAQAALPLRLLLQLRKRLVLFVSVQAAVSHRQRRHYNVEGTPLWTRQVWRIGWAVGLGGGPWP